MLLLINKNIPTAKMEKILDFACGIEYLHNYSLVHDDIMEGDDLRRGHQTVQKKFGRDIAILVGDELLTRGLEILYKTFPKDLP